MKAYDPRARFAERMEALPRLGLGVSTEFGAGAAGLDPLALRRDRPDLAGFLEIGADLARGVDATARAWADAGWPTTYHFLDVNLEDELGLEATWIEETGALARAVGAAWLCGDAGWWHVGPRDRGHGVLMPPILTARSASVLARNVRRLREASGFEVLPENPPAHVYAGDLHLLEYFARVAEEADAGLLLDVAHLAIYQRATGRAPLDALEGFPLERVVEVHLAGASEFTQAGRRFVDDDHAPEPLPETWRILEHVVAHAPNLRAVVYECERNPCASVLANFERLAAMLAGRPETSATRAGRKSRRVAEPAAPRAGGGELGRLQRTLFRMQHDPRFAAALRASEPATVASTGLSPEALAPLRGLDPIAVAADREGRRADQLLRNVTSEFRLSVAVGPDGDGNDAWIRDFPRSTGFHAAVTRDESLPLAFAAFAESVAEDARTPLFGAFVALERALAHARRDRPADRMAPPNGVALAGAARLVALPAGTHAAAVRWTASLDRASAPGGDGAVVDRARAEWLLVAADATVVPRFGRLRPVRVEPLAPLVAALLQRAMGGLDAAGLARFAADHGVARDALAAVVDEYVAEGVLVRDGAHGS